MLNTISLNEYEIINDKTKPMAKDLNYANTDRGK